MRSTLDLGTVRVALSVVAAILAFAVAFLVVSDRVGGWPLGYVISGIFALIAFFVIIPIARPYVKTSVKPTGHEPSRRIAAAPTAPLVTKPMTEAVVIDKRGQGRPTALSPLPPRVLSRVDREVSIAGETRSIDDSANPYEETVFEGSVPVDVGREGTWSYELPLHIGEILEGNLRETDLATFGWMIVNERNLADFLNGEDEWTIAAGEEDVKATSIRWRCPKKGR